MNAFIYENLWLNVSHWIFIAVAIIYTLVVIGASAKTWAWKTSGILFAISLVALGVFAFNAIDKQESLDSYQNDVKTHIQTVGQFDRVDGSLKLDAETPSVFRVAIGDLSGTCSVTYPADLKSALVFGCGSDYVPLENAKADLMKASEKTK